jgi:hypothetical protein
MLLKVVGCYNRGFMKWIENDTGYYRYLNDNIMVVSDYLDMGSFPVFRIVVGNIELYRKELPKNKYTKEHLAYCNKEIKLWLMTLEKAVGYHI